MQDPLAGNGVIRKLFIGEAEQYRIELAPTSNVFGKGHRLRVEISSSNFPRFDRNLNTGGNNYDEATGVVANNRVHHSKQYPSAVTITVVKSSATGTAASR